MGIVIQLSHPARASTAASRARRSAVSPFEAAVFVPRTRDHHSAGIESRCHHLLTCEELAPTSDAIASREGHHSMIERKEAGNDAMPATLGLNVLNGKATLSCDRKSTAVYKNTAMAILGKSDFRDQFAARVAAARKARGLTQAEMAVLLSMDQGTYKQYETRSLLPHHFIQRFCLICGVDFNWLFTGAGKAPAEANTTTRLKKPAARLPRAPKAGCI